MSYKTLASKWMKNKELMVMGMAVAFAVSFSGISSILLKYYEPVSFGVLLVCVGLTAMVYGALELNRVSKTM